MNGTCPAATTNSAVATPAIAAVSSFAPVSARGVSSPVIGRAASVFMVSSIQPAYAGALV
ncbi:hypothetical protein [Streptomyces sp. rh34]|uniref:hypothetical protein n=1 Tax=Streptomyces sp. rh34 TaxID=2034272 RepID=UPI001C54E585|nr:hypothetical protein [Streptomyces sp. rh34]